MPKLAAAQAYRCLLPEAARAHAYAHHTYDHRAAQFEEGLATL